MGGIPVSIYDTDGLPRYECWVSEFAEHPRASAFVELADDQKDVRNLNMSGEVFQSWDLSGFDLSGCDFRNTIFSHVDLSNTNLSNTRLDGVNFDECNLDSVDLRRATFDDSSDIYHCSMEGAITDYSEGQGELLRRVAVHVVVDGAPFWMGSWHIREAEHACTTAHCIAGWATTLSPFRSELDKHYGGKYDTSVAGALLIPNAASRFFNDNSDARKWLESLIT